MTRTSPHGSSSSGIARYARYLCVGIALLIVNTWVGVRSFGGQEPIWEAAAMLRSLKRMRSEMPQLREREDQLPTLDLGHETSGAADDDDDRDPEPHADGAEDEETEASALEASETDTDAAGDESGEGEEEEEGGEAGEGEEGEEEGDLEEGEDEENEAGAADGADDGVDDNVPPSREAEAMTQTAPEVGGPLGGDEKDRVRVRDREGEGSKMNGGRGGPREDDGDGNIVYAAGDEERGSVGVSDGQHAVDRNAEVVDKIRPEKAVHGDAAHGEASTSISEVAVIDEAEQLFVDEEVTGAVDLVAAGTAGVKDGDGTDGAADDDEAEDDDVGSQGSSEGEEIPGGKEEAIAAEAAIIQRMQDDDGPTSAGARLQRKTAEAKAEASYSNGPKQGVAEPKTRATAASGEADASSAADAADAAVHGADEEIAVAQILVDDDVETAAEELVGEIPPGEAAPMKHLSAEEVLARARESWEAAIAPVETPAAGRNFTGFAYSGWNAHSFAFSQVAYANFETVLAALPEARHRFFQFAPIQAMGYRIGDGLSRMQFTRYSKRGYDVFIRLVNKRWGPYIAANAALRDQFPEAQNIGVDRPADDRPGLAWWRVHRERLPYMIKALSKVTTLQPHPRDSFFNTVVHLFLTGGVYTDSTVAFRDLDPTPPVAQYAMLGDICPKRTVAAKKGGGPYEGWDLSLPTVLVFPASDHRALRCVLDKYSAIADGGTGLTRLETFCLSPRAGNGTTPLFSVEVADGAVPDDLTSDELDVLRPGHGGCARHLLETCIVDGDVQRLPVEWHDCDLSLHRNQWNNRGKRRGGLQDLMLSDDYDLGSVAGVFTGAAYHGDDWEEPDPEHRVIREIHAKRRASRWDDPTLRAALLASQIQAAAANNEMPDLEALAANGSVPSCTARLPPCLGYFHDYPELRTSRGLLHPDRERNAARTKCSPVVVVPGVEKGATTYLFSLLYQHPQMLPPLRGAGFKESAAFLNRFAGPAGLWEKVNRFPYIRAGDPFVTGDATILNMMEKNCPHNVRLDQPNPRVVFSLRDPVDRAWSGYRFSFNVWYKDHVPEQSYANVVRGGISSYKACMRRLGQEVDDTEGGSGDSVADEGGNGIDGYFECITKRAVDPYRTVWKGIYYYPVLHWMRVLGPANVMVITSEEMASDPQDVLRRVSAFAGLCTENLDFDAIVAGANANPTAKKRTEQIGKHGKSPDLVKELEIFFAPYNELLFELIGRRLPWKALHR